MAAFLSFALPAFALSTGGLGGYSAHPDPTIPYSESWFIYNLDLGERKEDAIVIFNSTDEPETVKLYPVDSVPSNQGNFALESQDAPRDGVGAWITLQENVVTIPPGESREIPFTITIPRNTDVGEHSGGIIIQKAVPGKAEGEAAASIVTRVGIRVYETVPGDIVRQVALEDFIVKPVTALNGERSFEVTLTARNQGNVSLTPRADLQINGWGKQSYAELSEINFKKVRDFVRGQGKPLVVFFTGQTLTKDWQLLRDQTVTTGWSWPRPRFGRFTFQVALTYDGESGQETLTTKTVTFWVIPWFELSLVAGIVLLMVAGLLGRRFWYSGRGWKPYTVQRGDQLVALAQRAGVSWRKVARMNKLKNPLVREGQTILLPPRFSQTPLVEATVSARNGSNGTTSRRKVADNQDRIQRKSAGR